jgi:hypothetical protein
LLSKHYQGRRNAVGGPVVGQAASGLPNRGAPTGAPSKPAAEGQKKDTAGFFKELIIKGNNKKVVANERKPAPLGGPNASGAPG